jgi:hypothetical protein
LNTEVLDKNFLNLIFNSLFERWKIGSFAKIGWSDGKRVFAKELILWM